MQKRFLTVTRASISAKFSNIYSFLFNKILWIGLFILSVGILSINIFWELPKSQVQDYRSLFIESEVKKLSIKEQIEIEKYWAVIENNARATIGTMMGGVFILISLYLNLSECKNRTR
jgi:hypothetical protein